jgi:hypothetical protein
MLCVGGGCPVPQKHARKMTKKTWTVKKRLKKQTMFFFLESCEKYVGQVCFIQSQEHVISMTYREKLSCYIYFDIIILGVFSA